MMRIQCAADFHGKEERYKNFLNGVKKNSPDIVVLAGDINSSFYLSEFLEEIDVPTLAIHGNMDGEITKNLIEKHAISIDGKRVIINDLSFVGAGGAHPFLEKIYCMEEKKWLPFEGAAIDILVTHVPPKGMMDKMMLGMHIGSKWIKEAIKEKKPSLVICGHVHENYGYEEFDDTVVVNCSVGKKGEYTIIDLNDDIKIKMVGY